MRKSEIYFCPPQAPLSLSTVCYCEDWLSRKTPFSKCVTDSAGRPAPLHISIFDDASPCPETHSVSINFGISAISVVISSHDVPWPLMTFQLYIEELQIRFGWVFNISWPLPPDSNFFIKFFSHNNFEPYTTRSTNRGITHLSNIFAPSVEQTGREMFVVQSSRKLIVVQIRRN